MITWENKNEAVIGKSLSLPLEFLHEVYLK